MGVVLNTEKLVRLMFTQNRGRAELARAAGVSEATVSNALAGKPVSFKTATKISLAFKDQPDVLDPDLLSETA